MDKRISRRDLARLASGAAILSVSNMGGALPAIGSDKREQRAGAASWHPEMFPELIVKSWYQEDLVEGEVPSWPSRGLKRLAAEQADPAQRPTKLPDAGGVLFKKGVRQALVWRSESDAPYLHRWWLAIARCDTANHKLAKPVPVFCINGREGGRTHRQPYVFFAPAQGLLMSQLNDGQARSEGAPCAQDFAQWNVILGYRRGFVTQAVVNGLRTKGQTLLGLMPNREKSPSFMGDPERPLPADLAIDCILIGQSELNDAQIYKLMGWAMWRVGRQSALPESHPYRNKPPLTIDKTDNPTRYSFNAEAWSAWATLAGSRSQANRGKPGPAIEGYTTVFFDDFAENTVVDDQLVAPGSAWYAPTHLVPIGVEAQAQRVGAEPSSYVHDAASHSLSLRLLFEKRWKTGAFSSVNNNGQGRSWGKGIFEIRAKFPKLASPRPGFFPAFWAYGIEHLFWRTRNRLETDFWEYDGLDGRYINITQHVHKPPIAYSHPGIVPKETRFKIAGYRLVPNNGFSAPIDIYDGEFHTWYAQIEEDWTYFVVDGFEVARVSTSPELAAKKYILVDFAYEMKKGKIPADPSQIYDLVIDYIRVRQKVSDLAKVPQGFDELPALSGEARLGSTLTVLPNVEASQIEYLWYRDGVPILGQTGVSCRLGTADAGHRIRCHVRAPSLLDQPEAWTAESAVVA
jgi:hypothetical protein